MLLIQNKIEIFVLLWREKFLIFETREIMRDENSSISKVWNLYETQKNYVNNTTTSVKEKDTHLGETVTYNMMVNSSRTERGSDRQRNPEFQQEEQVTGMKSYLTQGPYNQGTNLESATSQISGEDLRSKTRTSSPLNLKLKDEPPSNKPNVHQLMHTQMWPNHTTGIIRLQRGTKHRQARTQMNHEDTLRERPVMTGHTGGDPLRTGCPKKQLQRQKALRSCPGLGGGRMESDC